ncbi:hypothetical protein D4A92_24940 (plasmid) [Rhizobium rosettiformans]|uniref:Transcription factor zinc-finger domain-containing protein n=1 Tax=Rhizobium rosettiformans TaxID=1368430 RepID=A0ABX7F613_9HYPH|nr:zf-TFIIB domain-containing protein [Rhizobium rosettiformans]QRF54771.1 hypothetical protein D4A92_24940 [Rhizobium rosettiformans]
MALTSLFNRVLPAGQRVLPSPTRRAGYGSKLAQDREAHARQSIFHRHCPTCRGVWLDRGELDKIIEMSQSVPVPAGPRGDARPAQSERDSRAHRDNERYDDRGDYDDEHDPRRRKRKSMLGELFDF